MGASLTDIRGDDWGLRSKLLAGGTQKDGIEWRAYMGPMSINGYVKLPEGHPWNDKVLAGDDSELVDVHGGITYQSDTVIGFDTVHCYDAPHPDSPNFFPMQAFKGGHVWNVSEVQEEAIHLADQVAHTARKELND